jgi:uncharacterized membrane protein
VWDGDELVDVGTLPGGFASDAFGINNTGEITGSSDNAARDFVYAYVFRRGVPVQLPSFQNGGNAIGMAINERGDVVGQAVTSLGAAHAVLWTGAKDRRQNESGRAR